MNEQASSIGKRTSAFIITHPWKSLLLTLVATVVLWGGFPQIKSNFTHTAFFYDDDPLIVSFNNFERQFGNDDAVTVVVHSPSGIFDQESATLIRNLTEDMWQIPDVIQVESIANFSWVHAEDDDIVVEPLLPDAVQMAEFDPEVLAQRKKVALEHELLPDYLVSKDGTIGLIFAKLKPGIERPPDTEVIITATRELLAKYASGDHTFHLTGGPAINYAFKEISQRDMQTLIPVVLCMVLFFLILSFRSVGGTLMPLVVIVVSVSSAFAISGWLKIELNSITVILPQVLIAIGVADSVHVLSTFYRNKRRGQGKKEAALHSLEKNFIPTILTSLSTAIGFFAFSTAELKPISGLGLLAGFGTLYAWFVTYFGMGALMSLSPCFVNKKTGETQASLEASPFSLRTTDRLYSLRYPIVGVFAVVCTSAAVLSVQNTVNSDPYKYFAKGYPLRDAQDFILEHLGGVPMMELVVDSGEEDGIKDPKFLHAVANLEKQVISEISGINRAVSIVDILRQTNRSLHGGDDAYYKLPDDRDTIAQEKFLYEMSLPQGRDINSQVTIKNDKLRVSFVSIISDSRTWTDTAARVESMAKAQGLKAHVTGKTMLYQSMNGYVVESFITSLSVAAILISLLLVVFFRSFRTGGIALLPNIIPLIIGGAVLKLLNVPLDIGTVLVSSVCLGIAVDDTIHVMANYNQYVSSGRPPREAIALVITHTGPALITTTLVLVAGFGTLAFATFVPNIFFGIMTAVILTTALITDLTLLPALLMIFPPATAAQSSTKPATVP